MENLVNCEVFNKRNSTFGVVVAQKGDSLTIEVAGEEKIVSMSTFKRWWSVTPSSEPFTEQEKDEMEKDKKVQPAKTSRSGRVKEQPAAKADDNKEEPKEEDEAKAPSGEKGIGVQLRDRFVDIIKDLGAGDVQIFHNDENRTDVIKFNGFNIFECSYASRRFNVLAHPESLTPDNKKRITKLFPKEWGWSLRAKFVFTEISQWPLMKSIISDGLFYRKDVNKTA